MDGWEFFNSHPRIYIFFIDIFRESGREKMGWGREKHQGALIGWLGESSP